MPGHAWALRVLLVILTLTLFSIHHAGADDSTTALSSLSGSCGHQECGPSPHDSASCCPSGSCLVIIRDAPVAALVPFMLRMDRPPLSTMFRGLAPDRIDRPPKSRGFPHQI